MAESWWPHRKLHASTLALVQAAGALCRSQEQRADEPARSAWHPLVSQICCFWLTLVARFRAEPGYSGIDPFSRAPSQPSSSSGRTAGQNIVFLTAGKNRGQGNVNRFAYRLQSWLRALLIGIQFSDTPVVFPPNSHCHLSLSMGHSCRGEIQGHHLTSRGWRAAPGHMRPHPR